MAFYLKVTWCDRGALIGQYDRVYDNTFYKRLYMAEKITRKYTIYMIMQYFILILHSDLIKQNTNGLINIIILKE